MVHEIHRNNVDQTTHLNSSNTNLIIISLKKLKGMNKNNLNSGGMNKNGSICMEPIKSSNEKIWC